MRYLIFIGFLLLFSCKKDNNKEIIYGYHYFPIEEGKYVVYDVVDIFHDQALLPAHDTIHYQIKEVIGEGFEDLEGDQANKIYRYIRTSDTLEWDLKDVWSAKRTNRNAEVVEENQRMIKMAFAISYDQFWDYNALNSSDELTARYADIYQPKVINTIFFDSTVVVDVEDFSSYIEYRRFYEIYAPNIGKVQSVFKDIQINNGDTLDIAYGTEIFYSIVEWGNE